MNAQQYLTHRINTLPFFKKNEYVSFFNNMLDTQTLDVLLVWLNTTDSVQKLDISNNKIIKPKIREIVSANITMNIQAFSLAHNNLRDDGAAVIGNWLSTNTHLKTLILNYNNIGPVGINDLMVGLANNTQLKHLSLNCNNTGSAGAIAIGKMLQTNTTLGALDIEENDIGDNGAACVLAALLINQSLQTINLSFNHIGDASADAVSQTIRINHHLQSLIVCRNDFTMEGLRIICNAVKYNLQLTELDVHANLIDITAGDYIESCILKQLMDNKNELLQRKRESALLLGYLRKLHPSIPIDVVNNQFLLFIKKIHHGVE